MTRTTEERALWVQAQSLCTQYLEGDGAARTQAVRTLAHGNAKLLALTIRHIQIVVGARKTNEVVRNLCDAIGGVS